MILNKLSPALWLLAGVVLWAGSPDRVKADPPDLHGFFEITRHVHVEDSCGEETDSNVDDYRYFHLEGSTIDQAGFDFDRYILNYCPSTDTDDCERIGRYTRFFEVQAEDRATEQGVLVDNTGGTWHERGGGTCQFGWFRSILERTGDGVRIRLLNEAVELDLSEYDGPCRASEETAHLLDGSCNEARVIEGVLISARGDIQEPQPATDSTSATAEREQPEPSATESVTFDASSEEAINVSAEAMDKEFGDSLKQPMGLILLGYGVHRAEEQGLDRYDPDDAEAFRKIALQALSRFDGMTAREIVDYVETNFDEQLLRE